MVSYHSSIRNLQMRETRLAKERHVMYRIYEIEYSQSSR
jgi:hypothetical protein